MVTFIMKKVSGVDGCRGGWFAFHFDGKNWSGDLFEGINELYNECDSQILFDQIITIQERKEFEKYIQRYVFGD